MEQDERSQKLLAGKEKLAAFQRKRAKRKKKKDTDDGASEYTWSETSSLADLSDVASTGDFSDTGSVVDEENDWGMPVSKPRVSQSVALVRAQNDVRKMTSRITELEEMLQGKQDAMSRLMEENKQLQASQAVPQNTADLPVSAPGSLDDQGGSTDDRETDDQNADETYQHKLDEFEEALKKRDEVIAQLTENLRATTVSRDNLQQEYSAQAAELARQVQTLQLQLKQAGECLKNHMGEHGISAHALLEAKNELLALQQVNSHQEQDLTAARAAISERDQALHKLVEQYKAAAEQANLIHHEYSRVQQQNVQNAQLIEQLTHAREEAQSEKLATLQQCQELQNKAADTDLHSQQLSQQLKANQLKIQTLETSLQEANLEICRMKEVVEQKDESLKQMVHSLISVNDDQDASKVLRDTVDQQQNEISSLQEAVNHKDQKLQQLNEKFFETSEQLKTLYSEVSVLKEKEKEVIVLRQTLREHEETATTLQNNIQAKEQNLIHLQQSLMELQNSNKEADNEKTVTNLKDELAEKEKLLQEVSERFRVLAEKSGKLQEDSANVLLMKLQQLSQDNATLLEENKQLKETENEINEIAAKIPQLSHEIQRLGEENRELKQKENQMYQLIEDVKEREKIVNTLNTEKQQLTAAEEALQKENKDLQEKLISLQDVSESLEEIQSKYSELKQRINTLESERNLLIESEDLLKRETCVLKERNESLNRDISDMEQVRQEHSELLQRTKAADTDAETTAVKLAALQHAYNNIILESEKKDGEKKLLASQVAELEQQLRTTTRDVEEHQKSVSDSPERTNDLEDIKTEVESLREVVKKKEASLSHVSATVTKLTAEVTRLSEDNQGLIEQSTRFEQLQTELQSSTDELSNLRALLQQKEAMLEDTRNSVNNLEMQVSVLNDENKAMKESQNELRHLKDLVAAREKEVVELSKSISEKDKVIEEMSGSMDGLQKMSASLESTIAEKEKAMEELQGALTESKRDITDMSYKINEAAEKISQLQLENKGLQDRVIDNEKVQTTAVSEKDCIIAGLQENLGVRQVEIESLHKKLRQSEEEKAKLEVASTSLAEQLTDLRCQVDKHSHDNQDLVSQLSSKEDLNGKLEETIKEKRASLTELEEKVGLLTEELNRTHTECKNLQNEAREKEAQMTVLKKDISDYEIRVDKYDTENKLLQKEVQALKQATEELRDKEDMLVKTEGEVSILKEALKERDERLMELTDSMTKLTDEVSQMTGMNHVLQVREEELIDAQRNVQQHIDVVNEQIETLKAENQTLATKEHQLLETQAELTKSNTMLVEAKAKLITLQQDYDSMKATHSELLNREEEFMAMKEEINRIRLDMSQLDKENNDLKMKIETHELQNQLAAEEEIITASETNSHETQLQLERLYAENKELKQSLDGVLSSQKGDVAVSKESMAANHTLSDMPEVVRIDETVVAQAAPVEEVPPGVAAALGEAAPTVPCEESEEVKLLLVALDKKEEETAVLQSSIQTQHMALQQMHQQLTEVTQYVTHLNNENCALKAKLSSESHSPTPNVQISPNTQEAPSPTANTQSGLQPEPEVSKLDSAEGGKPTSEAVIEKPSVEMLKSQIDQQREALEDMSERYCKLVEENHAMRLQINRDSDKVTPSTTDGLNTGKPHTTDEVQENKDVMALHAYIQQQSAHMEQMSQRMQEMAQYVTRVQEQNKLLQEKDEINSKALLTQAQASDEAVKQRKQLEEQLQKENQLKESESTSESLTKLDQENKILKQKDKESTEVVQQLMNDIEDIRRSKSQSPSHSDVVTLRGSLSAVEHECALAALRAELEEQHGEQITEMKQQIMSNMNEQLKQITKQRDDLLEQLSIKEGTASQEYSPEEVESLNLVIQQCQLKLRKAEDERAEYLLKLQEQQDRFSEELAVIGRERDTTRAQIAEWELRNDKATKEFEQMKEDQSKEVELLNQRLAEVTSERDQAIGHIEKLKIEEPSVGSNGKERRPESSAREQHVEEMAKQLQDLARERDEALARIQAQEQSLNQPLQHQQHTMQSQVVDALKSEIDALNSQLNDVTSAKEEALTHVEKLQKAINSQTEDPSGSPQQESHHKSKAPTTPVGRKLSPQQKPLSLMQQQLLQLQQQLLQESPPALESVKQEAEVTETSPTASVSVPAVQQVNTEQGADKIDLQLKQMQEVYDQHCHLQARQIEQLTAELARVGREREELMSQLEQYQKHYESHVHNLVEQGKKDAADKVKAIHEELNEAKKERDIVTEKFESLQLQTKSQIRELTEQVAGWKGKYHEMSQSFTGDSTIVLARVQAETASLQGQIDDLQAKLEASEKEREDAKAQAKELKLAYYDLEGKDPNVAGYRQKLEDIEATLKVTWIENEELKIEVASLKLKLQKEDGPAPAAEVEDIETVRARLVAAEAELDRLHPLVGVEVIVLMRQMEDLRSTFSHQLRVHAQELTAVKCELARYQSLDSDSSESPVRTFTQTSPDKKLLEKPDSVDCTNIELGRVQAEHQLEVESLKKSKGEFALELHAEKERHRDAMARIEQLLKEMVSMQQKHKDDMEAVRKNHEETVHQMSVHIEEMKLQQLVNPANGSDNISEMKVHVDTIISEKQRLLTERDQLLQEKGDWDAERDRLKGRIAQVVGEKDLIAKERDILRESIQQVEQDQTELKTQQRLIDAEKQQLMFEREQLNFLKEQANQGKVSTPQSDNDSIRSLQAELASVSKYKDQVSILQQERVLLVDDHALETRSLMGENSELKLRVNQAESEKQQELEELRERLCFDINELQVKLETVEQEQLRGQQEVSSLRAENEQLVKEYSNRAVTQIAEWKLQREDMEKEYEMKLESLTKEVEERLSLEISNLKMNLRNAVQEAEQVRKERDTLKGEHTEVLQALRAQESEIVKLQTACSHLKEERDVLQSEYSSMLTSLQQEAADTRVPHLTSQVQQLTAQRQAMQKEHAQAMSALQEQYHTDQARLQHLLDQANTKHMQDLHQCTTSLEAEVELCKQKHAEVLEEVHTLRRENYEMRTVVSDPRTQQNIREVTSTTQTLTQSPPNVQADSLSQGVTTASDEERDFHKIIDEYQNKLKALEDQHEKDLQGKEAALQERYEVSQRQLQVEYQWDLQDQTKKLKDDAARETDKQVKLARIENERRFVTELQRARREISARYESQLEALRQRYEQQDLHQTTGLTTHQLQDIVTRLQMENKDLTETREALLEQIDKAHGHQEELQEEVTAMTTQKDALSTENLQLKHRLTQLERHTTHTELNWHPLPDSTIHFTRPPPDSTDSTDHQQLLEKYSMVLGDNQKLQQRLAEQQPGHVKSPSIPDSLEGSLEPPDLMMRLQDQIRGLQKENDDLRSHLDDQNLVAHEELGELQGKYIQLVAENESLRANLEKYHPDDLLDEDIDIRGADRRETERLHSCYATLAEENEVLRAKLGSYGLPTESAAEEENLDLASRYELIRKENEGLRAKLQAYTHQGALERDGCWKKKYDSILHDYAILRSQLEELGLPINDSIQKGLEELQVKFDQVVKEKETLQVKLTTVRDNAEQDFRELQARHSELHTSHTALYKEHAELKALLEKDKDKSKREFLKTKSKLSNTSKELESLRSKFEKATKETDALKFRLEQAEARLKQEASSSAPGGAGKGKKRKQERGNHSKGRKQRRESEALDDSVEMADQTIQEELDKLTTQYTSVVRENDALKSEVGGLKCELGSLKSRLMDSLRHRLRDPPVAHSTPLDSDFTHSQGNQDGLASTPTGRPKAGGRQQAEGGGSNPSSSTCDLDLSSPEDVEALRLQHEAALQELSQLRNELDRMNSKALDELMGLQSEADALEEENASMKQALKTDSAENTEPSSQGDVPDAAHRTQTIDELQQQLITIRKQFDEVQSENDDLRQIIEKAAGTSEQGNVRKDNSLFRNRGNTCNLTHRNVFSETEVHPVKENTEMAAASDQLLQKQKSKRTVSLDSIGVEVPVTDLSVEVKQPPLYQEGQGMNTVIPSSGLEGGQLEAEWKRIVRMRNRAASAGDAVAEEGFHPEIDRHALPGNKTGAFIPVSPNMETQLVWPSTRADSADLPLMSIEDEFKLQLESMVANFGEQNVREQLGRDYIEIHQKYEAIKEENGKLCAEASRNREEVVALERHIGELEQHRENGNEILLSEDPADRVGEVRELHQELVQLRDENQLLLQENTTLEAQCESQNAKSAWQNTVMRGDLESELEHLRSDRAKLEDEVGKIKGLYSTVKEHSNKLSAENEELSGDKVRLERELQVLRAVLEALRQEQVKVEDEIQDRVGEQANRAGVEVSQEDQNTLSAESVSFQKKARKKSPGRLLVADVPSGKSTKRGKKSASPDEPEPARKTASRSSPAPGKDSSKSGSPMKAVKEPPTKVKRIAQSHVHSSKESLVFEDKVGMSQLKQKVKELTAKNKTLQGDVEALKKQLAAADRTKDMQKLQRDNKALLCELEEMRGSLKSQHKLSEQIQDLRARIEALVKEKDTLKKENQALSDRINDGVSPPMMEFEELKVQNQQLITANRSLTEKLDRDLMQAEHELAEMREKHKLEQVHKAEIEDEYKNFRDRIEKELYSLQARYDEVVEERDFLETQLINNREHAEKDYHQLQAGYEEMRNEYEELQRAYDNDKDKARKELSEIKVKMESVKQDNEELKREIQGMTEDGARGKSGLQQQCALLQEDKHNLSREIKEYQNRLTTVEKAKEEVDKQLRELRTRYDNLKKYHEEEKVAAEEESDMFKTKYENLKADYDRLSETVEELKMEKNNLLHELNDSHAWCETLEMNLKETESTMHKETVTLKEELQFISEKLENETSVRNSLASAEEELRQKLIDTSQELDKAKREAQAAKEKHTAKLDNLHLANSDLTTQIGLIQDKLSEKQLEVEASNTELVSVRESYNQIMKSYEELSQIKEAMENEYRQMRNKFGVTESELQEFRKSYLTQNMESGKLMSRFRVQFEQVTEERDRLKDDLKQLNQQLQEIKAKHLVQLEDNRALRSAIGAEVDIQFQTVSQIESILGDDRPPISPISPLCQSPAMSDASTDYPEETGPSSGTLLQKLHKQNTSLAVLIQELENIKVARDQQMSRISTKYQSLQASFNDSLTSYNQDRSQLEEDLDKLRSHNEQLLETNQETEGKLQEMAKRCRVLEEELLRLQRNGADGTSSSTSTTEKVKKKYVVEMEDDVLTVSTVSITGEEPEQGSREEETMQCSPQVQSSAGMAAQQMPGLVRRSTDPELMKLTDKTWEREYHVLQDKYMALLKEHDKVWQRVRQSPSHRGAIDLEGELTIEVTDSSIIELIEENSRLHALSTKLENELMSQRIDCLEVDAAYTELTWLREQKVKLEEKLRLQYQMFNQEKQVLEQRLNELQTSLDKVISMKRRTSEEVLTLKNKYSDLLAVSSDEVKELAEQVSSDEDREKLVSKVTEMERLSELETQVKHERDEKEFLQVQVTHLKKECELYERHVRDLEKEIDEQYTHLHEASREHKTMVQLLAETKLELELNREKHQQVTKIGQTVERIEAQLSGRSTPQSALLCSPPLPVTSTASSPTQEPYIDSRPSTSCDSTEETQHLAETSRIVDEMVQLRHEIMEAKSMYSRERSLFRRAQQQTKSSPGDQTAIKEELAVIEEQNLLLKRENEDLQKRLSEQEELVFHLQARLSSDSTDDSKDTLEAVFKQQLVLFRSERDTLQQKVHMLEQHKQQSRDLLREKTIMEETFNQEREVLKQKLHEKELNEMELIHKITALEKHIREQQRLEELIYHKSSLEDEIRRQKESFDHELLDVEKTLQDRRNMIKIERVKLLGELKQKYWQKILNVDFSEATESASQPGHKPKSMASGFERLSRMKGEVEQRYREAIDRLRHELHADSHYSTQRSGQHYQHTNDK